MTEAEALAGCEGLVQHLIKRFVPQGMEREDLLQEARIGVIQAHRRYDPNKGIRFSTFVTPYIRGSVLKALQRKGPMISIPGGQWESGSKPPQVASFASEDKEVELGECDLSRVVAGEDFTSQSLEEAWIEKLKGVSERDRSMLKDFLIMGLSYSEVARKYGLKPNRANYCLKRGMNRLYATLQVGA